MHTQGPWTWQEIDNSDGEGGDFDGHGMGIFADENGNGERVAEVFTDGMDDVHLIAAAPELLAACRKALEALPFALFVVAQEGQDTSAIETAQVSLDQAIRKATGTA